MSLKILVAEDSSDLREILVARLAAQGWDVTVAENGAQALRLWSDGKFDVLSTDLDMPELNGLELTEQVLRLTPRATIIMFSGGNDDKAADFLNLGGMAFYSKADIRLYLADLASRLQARGEPLEKLGACI